MQFCLIEPGEFATLTAAGFETIALYGDYAYADFDSSTSPFMIWILRKID